MRKIIIHVESDKKISMGILMILKTIQPLKSRQKCLTANEINNFFENYLDKQ